MLGRLAKRTFHAWPRLGVWVLGADYHAPIPEANHYLQRHWQAAEMAGVELHLDEQLDLLSAFHGAYGSEWGQLGHPEEAAWSFRVDNPSFGRVDAEITYSS